MNGALRSAGLLLAIVLTGTLVEDIAGGGGIGVSVALTAGACYLGWIQMPDSPR
jgi:hypothetical protein